MVALYAHRKRSVLMFCRQCHVAMHNALHEDIMRGIMYVVNRGLGRMRLDWWEI